MSISQPIHTVEDFEHFINLPENQDKIFELIAGEIVEVPSNPFSSFIGLLIATALMNFVLEKNLGWVTGEAGGYRVAGERYAPDVAYISHERQPELVTSGYNPNPPELAVEVISDEASNDELRQLRIKLTNYLSVGTLVWGVYPQQQEVEVHAAGEKVNVYRPGDTLDGGNVLPDFTLAVNRGFQKRPK